MRNKEYLLRSVCRTDATLVDAKLVVTNVSNKPMMYFLNHKRDWPPVAESCLQPGAQMH